MLNGVVKWFSDAKGYGFIRSEGIAEDILVHQTSITMEGFRTLAHGDLVQFQVKRDSKGFKAINVVKTGSQLDVQSAPSPQA